jgi:hypothetical protein
MKSRVQLHAFLTSALDDVRRRLHVPVTLPPGKTSLLYVGYETLLAPDSAWTMWKEESFVPAGKRTHDSLVVQPLACSIYRLTYLGSCLNVH